jgi:DNA mismatch endonuclease (patch repair protein)
MERMSTESRSKIMRAIKSKDTKPEMLVRRGLHAAGFRYRLHVRDLPGRPDLVFPQLRAIVEVRGCFWHSHCCIGGRVPMTNSEFWLAKLEANRKRDISNLARLRTLGYAVKIIWECDLQPPEKAAKTIREAVKWLGRRRP